MTSHGLKIILSPEFTVYIVWPSVSSLNNLKLHKRKAVKNICRQGKFMLLLTFNPGLALTSFQTNQSSDYNKLT